MANLERQRLKVRPMLHFSDPADALYVYYTSYHDPQRTELRIIEKGEIDDRAEGFVAICQTGQRLFQPTVVLHATRASAAVELLRRALTPGRLYYLITRPGLKGSVAKVVTINQPVLNRVYRLNLSRFTYTINVMVVTEQGMARRPRFVVRRQEEIAAEAGTSWASPHFAEVFVRATPEAQMRGWDQAVLGACTAWAIRSAIQPLYIIGEEDQAGIELAERIGYTDTGAREFTCEGVCKPGQDGMDAEENGE